MLSKCISLGHAVPDPISKFLPSCALEPAVDMRNWTPSQLYREGFITLSALDTIIHGRKWHKEFNSAGAVGIHRSNINALRSSDTSLLLMEEDCTFRKDPHEELTFLQNNEDFFDVAIFGCFSHAVGLSPVRFMPPGWFHWQGNANLFHLHCVYYTRKGRAIVRTMFDRPLAIHIDHWLRLLSHVGHIRLIVQLKNKTAVQAFVIQSTIGHDLIVENLFMYVTYFLTAFLVLCCVIRQKAL